MFRVRLRLIARRDKKIAKIAKIANVCILLILVQIQTVTPSIGLPCSDRLFVQVENDQSCHTDASAQNLGRPSCCVGDSLPKPSPASRKSENSSTKHPGCDDNCKMCSLSCCSGTSMALFAFNMNTFSPFVTSMPPPLLPLYCSITPGDIFRPPRP